MVMHLAYPGSFDPFTLGHLDIAKRASVLGDSLTILVVDHKNCYYSLKQRMESVRASVTGLDNVKVVAFEGLLIDALKSHELHHIVRGLRNEKDFHHEYPMAQMNRSLSDGRFETMFLASNAAISYISSSLVREIAKNGGSIAPFVHPDVVFVLQ